MSLDELNTSGLDKAGSMLTFRKMTRKTPEQHGLSAILVEVGRLQYRLARAPSHISKTQLKQVKSKLEPLHRKAEALRVKFVLGKGVTSRETSVLRKQLTAFVDKYDS